jgi:hypothetical protein
MPGLQNPVLVPQTGQGRLLAIKEKKRLPDVRVKIGEKASFDIIDIRQGSVEMNLKVEILSMFLTKNGPRKLPTLLLYDERGLQLFEKVRQPLSFIKPAVPRIDTFLSQITYLEEYYLTNDEIEVLQKYSADIAKLIPEGAMLIELGSG